MSKELNYCGEGEYFALKTEEEREFLRSWIRAFLLPVQTVNKLATSYRYKHMAEDWMPSGYVSNADMKRAMCECGFKPTGTEGINWYFNVAMNSPAFLMRDEAGRDFLRQLREAHLIGKPDDYERILEILDDYWITEPDEEEVVVDMYFRHHDGQEQYKHIVWHNPKFPSEAEYLERMAKDEKI